MSSIYFDLNVEISWNWFYAENNTSKVTSRHGGQILKDFFKIQTDI